MRKFARATFLLAAFMMLAAGCQTTKMTEYRTLSQRPDRQIVQLHNGLIVVAQRIPTAPVVSVQCYVKTGSIYEGVYNGAGLSHFLEHLAAGGTTAKRSEAEVKAVLAKIGGQTNASTSLDQVRYYINTSSDHAPEAIELVSDAMQSTQITEKEFARERDVIQREFAMGEGEPSRIFWKLTQQARYRSHPARHPTIGYLDEFLKITRDQIYDFYKRMYVPNNMVFVVVGDVDPKATVDRVAALWRDASPGPLPGVVFPVEKQIDSPRELTGFADIDRPRLRLSWPGVRLGAEHDFALDLLAQILGQGELSRLVQTVRNEQGLVTSVMAYNSSFAWGEGFFGIDAVVAKEKMDEARKAILTQVERIKTFGIAEDELARAKSKTIAHAVYASQTAQDTAERLADDIINTGDPDYLQHYVATIKKISVGEVVAAAQKFLLPNRLVTVQLLPQKGKTESLKRPVEEPADPFKRQAAVELINLDNDSLVQKMQGIEASKDDARVAEVHPMQMVTLPNGLRVIVQRDTRLPLVSMQWYHLGGLLGDEAGKEGVANATALMTMRGAGDKSADDISRTLDELGALMGADCGNSTNYLTATSLTKDYAAVLGLMSEVIQKPTFADKEWAKLKPRLLAVIDSQKDQWYTQLRSGFRNAYFGNHPWSQAVEGRREVVDGLTTAQMKEFHEKRLSATESVLAIFGDIDEKAAIARATELFASLPAAPAEKFEARDPTPQTGKIVQVQTAKPTPAVQIGYGPGMVRTSPDYPAALVMTRVLSSFPVGRFDQALRGEGKGLVYAVGAGMFTGEARGYWSVLFNTQPDTIGEAMGKALDVVQRIKTEKVEEGTLANARTAVLVGEAFGRQTAGDRAAAAAIDELYGLGYNNSPKFIAQIRAVTAPQVYDVANIYLKDPLAVILTNQPLDESKLPPLTPAAKVEEAPKVEPKAEAPSAK
jgi:zinc protease